MHACSKRSFTAKSLPVSFIAMVRALPWLVWGYLLRGIERSLAERILLVISAVNGCRYCSWLHAHLASRCKVPSPEVESLLQQVVPRSNTPQQRSALLFAIHYAEMNGQLTAADCLDLSKHFEQRQVKALHALCAAINFGNLCGNTFDAFLHRLRGRAVEDSSLIIETVVFILCAPFLVPLLPLL